MEQTQQRPRPISAGQADDEMRDGSSQAVTCSWRGTILLPIRRYRDGGLPELLKFCQKVSIREYLPLDQKPTWH
jgi:hypothetical protein